jgi:hypothetical protein
MNLNIKIKEEVKKKNIQKKIKEKLEPSDEKESISAEISF